MSNLVSLTDAYERLGKGQTVFVDARFVFGEPLMGYEAYLQNHLPGAVYFDLNEDLSGPIEEHGGRHPLPYTDVFAHKLGRSGINEYTDVIIYDDQEGCVAARLWWLLRYFGHTRVKVMEEGFSAWKAAGLPVTPIINHPESKLFVPNPQEKMLVSMREVRSKIGDPTVILIDSRTKGSYTGEQPTKYPINGHIPGAINRYWAEGVSSKGIFLGAAEQKKRFNDIHFDKEIIVYCNAGVSACPNVLALAEADYSNIKLYVGSWGDWISYGENEIAQGDELNSNKDA